MLLSCNVICYHCSIEWNKNEWITKQKYRPLRAFRIQTKTATWSFYQRKPARNDKLLGKLSSFRAFKLRTFIPFSKIVVEQCKLLLSESLRETLPWLKLLSVCGHRLTPLLILIKWLSAIVFLMTPQSGNIIIS